MKKAWLTCSIVNWILRNKVQWYFIQNTKLFIDENAFENIVCEIAAILSRGRWVNFLYYQHCHLPYIALWYRIYSTSYYHTWHYAIQWFVGSVAKCSGGHFKNGYELLNLRTLKISMLFKSHIFQCMGKIFCVEFQRVPLKCHTKYYTHTLKDADFIHGWKFKSS